jgi:anthraniloyl-CoA monooxygenase
MFDGLTFIHERGPDGVFAVHGYPISRDVSTFIVETDDLSWRRAGLDEFDVTQPPGASDMKTKAYLEELFGDHLQGHELLVNNSRWGNFHTWRTGSWRADRVVLLGDAAHTAHFSVGSGTKMAMEDAAALASSLGEHGADIEAALDSYERRRRPQVERIQGSARPSLSWWEHFGLYHDRLEPTQFAFHFLTRAITRDNLQQRDRGFVDTVESEWVRRHGQEPLCTPVVLGGVSIPRRLLAIEQTGGQRLACCPGGDGCAVPLHEAGTAAGAEARWGLWLAAPPTEREVPDVVAELEGGLAAHPSLVAIHGGTSLTRTLLAEECRLVRRVPAVVVEETFDRDRALRLLLSGRADAVAVPAAALADGGPVG